MRVLYLGLSGDDVTAWQNFLRGIDPASAVTVTGTFDGNTKVATQAFQRTVGLTQDGVVGPLTMSKALSLGYCGMKDDRPDWPPPPAFGPASSANRSVLFGTFSYVPAPIPSNPEAIRITDGWDKANIVSVPVPQLKAVNVTSVLFHKSASAQLQQLFADWESAGLIDKILTWGGSWAPRFIRGSRTTLSNHAWGTAFDINVQWNMLGTVPALAGAKGSVRELVEIANNNGFYWGGHFKGRPDGMHFEVAKLVP